MSDEPAELAEIAVLVMAAGRSSRMGTNKLLAPLADGRSLIAHVVDQAIAAGLGEAIVVVGHESDHVRAALAGRQVQFVENPDFAQGLSTSLQAGVRALPAAAPGFFVCLGDMPAVGSALLARMRQAFASIDGAGIVVPMRQGKRGNPVLWSSSFIPELLATSGDFGARNLIGLHADLVIEIEAEDDGVFTDLDTPEALDEYRRSFGRG